MALLASRAPRLAATCSYSSRWPASRPGPARSEGASVPDNFAATLRRLIRARFPLLSIQTAEESRLLAEIAAVVGNRTQVTPARQVYTWSTANGFAALGQPGNPDTRTPHAALTAAAALTAPERRRAARPAPVARARTRRRRTPSWSAALKDTVRFYKDGLGAADADSRVADPADPAGAGVAGHPRRLPAADRAADPGDAGRDDRAQHRGRGADGRARSARRRSGWPRPRLGLTAFEAENAFARAMVADDGLGSPTTTSPSCRRRRSRSCRSPACWRWSSSSISAWTTSAGWRT